MTPQQGLALLQLAALVPLLPVLMRPVFEDQPGASPATSATSRPVFTEFGCSSRMSSLPLGRREFVIALDQQPVLALLTRFAVHAHEMPVSA